MIETMQSPLTRGWAQIIQQVNGGLTGCFLIQCVDARPGIMTADGFVMR